MAAKETMSWSAGRWHKKVPMEYREIAGRKHVAVSPKQLRMPATKEGSRAAANAWYETQLNEWQATTIALQPSHWQKVRAARVGWLRTHNQIEDAAELESKSDAEMQADFVEKLATELVAFHRGEKGTTAGMVEEQIWDDRLARTITPAADRTNVPQMKCLAAGLSA